MKDEYKDAVDDIYNTISDLHDNDMRRYVSGIMTLVLPHNGDETNGTVQAVFDPAKTKRVDMLRKMYRLFALLLYHTGVDLTSAKDELNRSYKLGDRRSNA